MNRQIILVGCNGDELNLTSGGYRTSPDVGLGSPSIEYVIDRTYLGRRIREARPDRLPVSFTTWVLASTPDEHDNARQRLLAALVSRPATPLLLVVERDGGARRAITGRCVTSGFGEIPASDSLVSEVRIDIDAVEDPFWVALEAQVAQTTIGVSTSTPWVGEMPIGAAVDIGWAWDIGGYYIADADTQTLTVENEGGLDTWPVWQISGPASTLTLGHERTGLVTSWAGTLLNGEVLEIVTDPKKRAVTIGTANAWSGIALESVMSPLLPGGNKVQVGLTGGTTGQTSVQVTSHSRYVSA